MLVRKLFAAAGAVALVVGTSFAAIASSVDSAVVDTTAPTGAVSLQAGQAGAFTISLSVTGNQDGTATFMVNRDWVLANGVFAGSNPQTFTVAPRNGGDPATSLSTSGTITVASGQATGSFALNVPVFGITNSNSTGGKLAAGARASYTVDVTTPSPPSDATAPVIIPSVSGTLGDHGWYTSDVMVSWSVTDAQSAVSSSTGCGSVTRTSDTTGTTYTCTASSAGGTSSQSVTIKLDATDPSISASPSPAANGGGYNNTSVTIGYTCSDATSGLVGVCPADDSVSGDGTHTTTRQVTDQAGNTASVTTTTKIDGTNPTISGSRTPAANGYGWNNGPVTVSFTCSDLGTEASGIKSCVADGSSPTSDSITLSSDGSGQTVSGTATDNADNTGTTTVTTINIDTTPPGIALLSRTSPNGNGWNDGTVTVTWACSDSGSGAVSATVTETVTTEGADQSVMGTCEDRAGNQVTDTVGDINIDTSVPTITFVDRSPDANPNGWNRSSVTVSWTCTDSVSGVVFGSDSHSTIGDGANQSLTGTCEDLAGNTASDTYGGIDVDSAVPTVTDVGSTAPAGGSNGWYTAAVTNTFRAEDGLSGFVGNTDPHTFTVGTGSLEGSGITVPSGAVTDRAGNVGVSIDSAAFKIDLSDPTNVAFVGGPANGSSHYFGSVPAEPTCTAADAISGLASCLVTGYSTAVGTHTVTATATDNAGRMATATRSYTVLAWTTKGYYAPVDMGGVLNTIKGGSTVPLKFEVLAGSTELTSTDAIDTFKTMKVNCTGLAGVEDAIEIVSTGGTSLRYDSTGGQFIQNWKTPTGAGNCYSATVTTDDGSNITAYFKLK